MVWKLFLCSSLRKSWAICWENSDMAKYIPQGLVHENHQKQSLKAFSARENHYLDHLWYSFSYRKYMGKAFISVIAGRTQTRISWARNWISTFCKKRLLRIEKLFHTNSTCIFLPQTPYPLKWLKFCHIRIFPAYTLWFSQRRP